MLSRTNNPSSEPGKNSRVPVPSAFNQFNQIQIDRSLGAVLGGQSRKAHFSFSMFCGHSQRDALF